MKPNFLHICISICKHQLDEGVTIKKVTSALIPLGLEAFELLTKKARTNQRIIICGKTSLSVEFYIKNFHPGQGTSLLGGYSYYRESFDACDILIQLASVLPVKSVKSHSYVGNYVKQIHQANIGLLCQVVTALFVDHSNIATKYFQGMARKITKT